jgi:hypothetical protein
MRLKYNNKIMDHGTLRDFNLGQDAVVQLLGPLLMGGAEEMQAHTIEPPKQIGFFVKVFDSRVVYLQASDCDTIDAVKGMLQQKIDVPARKMRLMYNDKVMYMGSLRDFNLVQDTVVHLLGPLLMSGDVFNSIRIIDAGDVAHEEVASSSEHDKDDASSIEHDKEIQALDEEVASAPVHVRPFVGPLLPGTSRMDLMAGRQVKKHILKVKKQPKTPCDSILVDAMRQAAKWGQVAEIDILALLKESSAEELDAIVQYIRHEKSTNSRKLEVLPEMTKHMKHIVQVRDYLDEVIAKYRDVFHDGLVEMVGDTGKPLLQALLAEAEVEHRVKSRMAD